MMVEIDGSFGEGGGQILRTALALSLVTGKPLRMRNIRSRRDKPGLRAQHLAGVRAAAQVGHARLEGDRLHSQELVFEPTKLEPGEYTFSIGTAGSTALLLQTVLPALVTARGPSTLVLEGGTHASQAPPFDYVEKIYVPLVNRMGPRVETRLQRHGFYPRGGGRVRVRIEPAAALRPLELLERGPVVRQEVTALVSALPLHIADREAGRVGRKLDLPEECRHTVEVPDPVGPGNIVMVEVECERARELFTAFGRRGVRAEKVADEVVRETRRYLEADVPVGEHLADQLLLPLALAGGGRFRTTAPTEHATTNAHVIRHFLDVHIEFQEEPAGTWLLEVRPG